MIVLVSFMIGLQVCIWLAMCPESRSKLLLVHRSTVVAFHLFHSFNSLFVMIKHWAVSWTGTTTKRDTWSRSKIVDGVSLFNNLISCINVKLETVKLLIVLSNIYTIFVGWTKSSIMLFFLLLLKIGHTSLLLAIILWAQVRWNCDPKIWLQILVRRSRIT